jgi:hypothetical protein
MSARRSANYTSVTAELFQQCCYSYNNAGNLATLLPASRGSGKQEITQRVRVSIWKPRETVHIALWERGLALRRKALKLQNTATRALGAE